MELGASIQEGSGLNSKGQMRICEAARDLSWGAGVGELLTDVHGRDVGSWVHTPGLGDSLLGVMLLAATVVLGGGSHSWGT